LQIISVDQFERVRDLSKTGKSKAKYGARGRYLLPALSFVAAVVVQRLLLAYQGEGCLSMCYRRKYGGASPSGKTYAEHLILPPIIEFLAGFIQSQVDFCPALDTTAAKYGKSITEEAIEAAIHGELASVQAGKQRLIDAISLGILTHQEAAVKLTELREQEQRLTVEMSSIAEKAELWPNGRSP
jgi:hypothetical protein